MKRYLLFCGSNYYPSGGWNDFCGDFETIELALKAAANNPGDWWHIVDTQERVVIEKGKKVLT